ncbi:MAG: hypothetical protein P4L51_12825 [Puia sp.]|nr:hypothetical protein [Puia sp.]
MTVSDDYDFYALSANNIRNLFAHFFDLNNPQVFSAIAKLTGLHDEQEIEKLAIKVWADLWIHRNELLNGTRPGVFIYRVVLQHVFLYLEKQGKTDRIGKLRAILFIDPAHYGSFPAPVERAQRSPYPVK